MLLWYWDCEIWEIVLILNLPTPFQVTGHYFAIFQLPPLTIWLRASLLLYILHITDVINVVTMVTVSGPGILCICNIIMMHGIHRKLHLPRTLNTFSHFNEKYLKFCFTWCIQIGLHTHTHTHTHTRTCTPALSCPLASNWSCDHLKGGTETPSSLDTGE